LFCFNCGHELPIDSKFCIICGVAQLYRESEPSDTKKPRTPRGQWEYNEFAWELERYTHGKKYWSESLAASQSPPRQRSEMNVVIEQGLLDFLSALSGKGWEPLGPLDAEGLWATGKVMFVRGGWAAFDPNKYKYELFAIHLKCRRWVEV
jgi:zinc-ribbon domain